jgi:type I restriction enzyme M protein
MAERRYPKADELRIRGNEVFSTIRQKWVQFTPEEKVRQEFLRVLIEEYGYSSDQFAEIDEGA